MASIKDCDLLQKNDKQGENCIQLCKKELVKNIKIGQHYDIDYSHLKISTCDTPNSTSQSDFKDLNNERWKKQTTNSVKLRESEWKKGQKKTLSINRLSRVKL